MKYSKDHYPGIKTKFSNVLSLRDTSKPRQKWLDKPSFNLGLHIIAKLPEWKVTIMKMILDVKYIKLYKFKNKAW